MTSSLLPLTHLDPARFETPAILKQLVAASRELAELKSIGRSIPSQAILISALVLQEAKDSSAIENIITTHDELFKNAAFPEISNNAAAKEVARYTEALCVGFKNLMHSKLLTANAIQEIQAELENNNAGFRKQAGTTLRNNAGKVVYTPPQDHQTIIQLMGDLEKFINDEELFSVDPLIKMALIHHQFESIHPFYDGNGRTGRIINVLYLVQHGLLESPILYLSRYLMKTKPDYYRLLQAVRDEDAWEEWVLYMLKAIENTASETIATIKAISEIFIALKNRIRDNYKFYSQDLINILCTYPYTKIDFIKDALKVSYLTATKYLEQLSQDGVLMKQKIGRSNYYINAPLRDVLTNVEK